MKAANEVNNKLRFAHLTTALFRVEWTIYLYNLYNPNKFKKPKYNFCVIINLISIFDTLLSQQNKVNLFMWKKYVQTTQLFHYGAV